MYSPTESLLGALLLALPCLKLVGNGRRNKNPANARFGLGLFQNEHARVALQALRVEEEDVFCSRDFMAVLSTRWSSFSIMMDAVPAAMLYGEISTQPHVRPRISPIHILHAKDGLIASFRWASSQTSSARKIVSASQTSRFLGDSLRNRGMESWIFLHKLLLLLVFAGYLVAFVMYDEPTIISVNN